MDLNDIRESLENQLKGVLDRCGLMYRVFSRVKTVRSLEHKMKIKGDKYRAGNKMQDMLGIRIVLYFPEDVELLGFYFSCSDLVNSSIDIPDVDTFHPQRLNLTKTLPENLVEDFRKCLPAQFAPYIDDTYEVQIRTIFSEGWHEVEHDMRYKCKDDWKDYGKESRILNGMIATLETAEWSMSTLFREMARKNMERGELSAMLRNKLRIRLADDNFSPKIRDFLLGHRDVLEQLFASDRMVLLISFLTHKSTLPLTYDNITFLINHMDIMNDDLLRLESETNNGQVAQFLQS